VLNACTLLNKETQWFKRRKIILKLTEVHKAVEEEKKPNQYNDTFSCMFRYSFSGVF